MTIICGDQSIGLYCLLTCQLAYWGGGQGWGPGVGARGGGQGWGPGVEPHCGGAVCPPL